MILVAAGVGLVCIALIVVAAIADGLRWVYEQLERQALKLL